MGDKELKELEAIKKLLVLSLFRAGASTAELSAVLGVTARTIRNMLPMEKIKKTNVKP
ncbi:MAG: helix-turn-helix domain-containing protein [Candidatus Brocadiales bacterium]